MSESSGLGLLHRVRTVDPDAPSHPLARCIWKRPEVHDVERHELANGRERFIVTFETWGVPDGFRADYGLDVDEFYLTDPRPLWKQVFGLGPPARLGVSYSREVPSLLRERDTDV